MITKIANMWLFPERTNDEVSTSGSVTTREKIDAYGHLRLERLTANTALETAENAQRDYISVYLKGENKDYSLGERGPWADNAFRLRIKCTETPPVNSTSSTKVGVLVVALQHADIGGDFETLTSYTLPASAMDADNGKLLLDTLLPFTAKPRVRLTFTATTAFEGGEIYGELRPNE